MEEEDVLPPSCSGATPWILEFSTQHIESEFPSKSTSHLLSHADFLRLLPLQLMLLLLWIFIIVLSVVRVAAVERGADKVKKTTRNETLMLSFFILCYFSLSPSGDFCWVSLKSFFIFLCGRRPVWRYSSASPACLSLNHCCDSHQTSSRRWRDKKFSGPNWNIPAHNFILYFYDTFQETFDNQNFKSRKNVCRILSINWPVKCVNLISAKKSQTRKNPQN